MTSDSTGQEDEINKYHDFTQNMPWGYALHELIYNERDEPIDYRILDINPAFEKMTGLKRKDILGQKALELYPVLGLNLIKEFSEMIHTGTPVHFKKYYSNKNRYLHISVFPVASNLFCCSINDITERKQTEKELRESNAIHSAMMENIGDVIALLGPDGTVKYKSPNIEKWFGWKPEDLVGTDGLQNVHPRDMERIKGILHKLISEGRGSETMEFRYRCGDNTYTWVELTAASLIKNPLINGILLNYHDINERKKAELSLEESEKRFKALHNASFGGIAIHDKGLILDCNQGLSDMTGYSVSELIGMDGLMLIAEDSRDFVMNKIVSGDERPYEAMGLRKNGEKFPMRLEARNVPYKGKQVRTVEFRDLTRQKQADRALEEEKQKLDASLRKSQKLESLGILAGGIAHDFNNLLTGIFGYIELALDESSQESVTALLSEAIGSLNRARGLTRQLLTFAKGGEPVKTTENLFPFIRETSQFALSGSSVSIDFNIQDDLWTCSFDKNQIGQVVDNLIINAQQAMPKGGTISVEAMNITLEKDIHNTLPAGDYIRLSFKDQGIGIPKEYQTHIFDPYYTTKEKGHGLGLATSYSIIRRHGGAIEIESEPGQGSTFHIYLPASFEPVSRHKGDWEGIHRGKGTMLVLDDEADIRMILKMILESFGYDVILVERGEDAVDYFTGEHKAKRLVAGIICDLTIPGGMGGKEVIEKIRKMSSDTPAFVVSGYSEDPIMANPEKYGFTASIPKPFNKIELSEILNKYMG